MTDEGYGTIRDKMDQEKKGRKRSLLTDGRGVPQIQKQASKVVMIAQDYEPHVQKFKDEAEQKCKQPGWKARRWV